MEKQPDAAQRTQCGRSSMMQDRYFRKDSNLENLQDRQFDKSLTPDLHELDA